MKYDGVVAGTEKSENYRYDAVYIDVDNSDCQGFDVYFEKGKIPHNLKTGTKVTITIEKEASP